MGNLIAGITGTIFVLAVIIGFAYGYANNIFSLVSNNESVGMIVGRTIGIFVAPLGALLGYF